MAADINPASPGAAMIYRYAIPAAVALVIIVLRNSRPRRLRVERLWIYPVILVAMLAAALAAAPPPLTLVGISLLIAGFALGCLIGWWRGRLTRIDIDMASHDLTSRSSPIGIALILVVFALRFGLRGFLAADSGILGGIPVIAVGDALVVLAVGMLSVQRLEMWIRASRMLAEAQGGSLGGPDAKPPSNQIVS